MGQLIFEKHDQVGIVKIDRPEGLNALNQSILHELDSFLEGAVRKHHLRVLVLTGNGDKAFIAGADIKEMESLSTSQAEAFCRLGQRVTYTLEHAPFITIAAVNGYALGGGLELALACDFIYASSNALLGLPEVGLGLIPGFGGTHRLAQAVGTRKAKELIYSGRKINAEEAMRIGLLNKVCEPEKLLDESLKTAQEILKQSFAAVLKAKRSINQGFYLPIEDALEVECVLFQACFEEKDAQEGLSAFLQKRQPAFQ